MGAYPFGVFFTESDYLGVGERIGQDRYLGRYCGRLRVAAARYRGKDLVLLRMEQSIRQCR